MSTRSKLIDTFLINAGFGDLPRRPLAGDASMRKYLRIGPNSEGVEFVVMDAPPELGNDTQPFVQITEYLLDAGMSAPQIYAHDPDLGFMQLEDLGDDLFARVLERAPHKEQTLYTAAADVLAALHETPPPDIEHYDTRLMTELAAMAYDWYLWGGEDVKDPQKTEQFKHVFSAILETHVDAPSVLIQRDYHAENLLWLPHREGTQRVGLLDYQDARIGHLAYDLVSLLKDARRDVSPDVEARTLEHYISITGQDAERFMTAYQLLGIQRNLRILGVFARLSMHFGKPSYIDLIPRVWDHLLDGLNHPAAHPIAQMLLDDLPEPTPEILRKLKDKCATIPTL